jgi:hypothetical protein
MVRGSLIFFICFLELLSHSNAFGQTSPEETINTSDQSLIVVGHQDIYDTFLGLFDHNKRKGSLDYIRKQWQDEFIVMVLDVITLSRDPNLYNTLFRILEEKTGVSLGHDFQSWYAWIWNRNEKIFNDYASFKSQLFAHLDPRFDRYFRNRDEERIIRLDEVRWGGVIQDGIPPLRSPKMIIASEADYLKDSDIVFGIELKGEIRAYPKRILAWHEMFSDVIAGIPVAGVYCTLCGTVILYNRNHQGVTFDLGTSGFLYRSNKLMYDQKTQSLWNTLHGKPVIGPLVQEDIALESFSVVTTTWGSWKQRHPKTVVLDINTGHQRDYGEGVAYQSYFSTDELMFNIPNTDARLKNKDEVLIIRPEGYEKDPLAISTRFLRKKEVFQGKINDTSFVVLTDKSGANRVYESKNVKFEKFDRQATAIDKSGNSWKLYEDRLENKKGEMLPRLPYHRAFWFGWFAAFPNTRLVK